MVLDASVILKWFMQEDDSDKAKTIKDDHIAGRITITAPDVIIYEVGNALRYEPEFSPEEVNRVLSELYELNLDIVAPLPDIIKPATEVAYSNKITFYDAFYIALAKELGLQFVTADEKLYNKIKDIPLVNLLSKFIR